MVRAGALSAGLAALVCAVVWSVAPCRDIVAFRRAHLCGGDVPTPAPAAHGCLAREIGTVTGRHAHTESTSDESGTSTHTYLRVTYRRASGARETREVTSSVYGVAASGVRADLATWRGAVVWITVAGRSDRFDPPAEDTLKYTALLGWTGLGLLVWFLLGDGTVRHLFGNLGLRPAGWLGFGAVTGVAVYVAYTYELGPAEYVGGTLVWLLSLTIAAYCVFGEEAFGNYRSDDSVLDVVLERLRRRGRARRGVAR